MIIVSLIRFQFDFDRKLRF